MAQQAYFGIDSDDDNTWVLAQCLDGKTILVQRFRNTNDGLDSLKRFIRDKSGRPRLCIKLTNKSTLDFLKYLSAIPDIEVIFVNEVGFRQYQLSMTHHASSSKSFRAELLAHCAERMI
ncbi:hypothetical protein [Methyloterricola oryzae]|uniref:hypothetical protein n=1 Tax=Methyloterricola oryzae TaxID=1495050 RepID=UPI0011AF67B5|nr:hypothetical protein [Methyloterricola oryzae]